MSISTEKPELLITEPERPKVIANSDYPLFSIDHRRFEKLTYWIYRAEIEKGSWKGKYEDIRLMSGISDGAKDCALYNNEKLVAIIQCKHSEKDTRLSVSNFVKELLKFGLYCLKEINLISNPSNFEYYIASSSGFDEDCLSLINDFKNKIVSIEKFEKLTKSVINAYASLKDMEYLAIEKPLKLFLSQLVVYKIDKEEINRLLTNPYQTLTINAFFEAKIVMDVESIKPLEKAINKITNKLFEKEITVEEVMFAFKTASCHLLSWNSFIDINETIHIERSQVSDIINWVLNPLNAKEKPITLLVGDAGVGKTVVLKDVYEKLTQSDIPIIGIKADKVYAKDIQGLEKELDLRESLFDMLNVLKNEYEKIVIIIDQIDALSQSLSTDRKYLNTYNLLIEKLSEIPGVRIIISARKFDLNYDPSLKGFKKNKIIELGLLSEKEVDNVFLKLSIPKSKINKRLFNTLRIPHHLHVFCEIYTDNLSLSGIQELQDLYNELWKQKVIEAPNTSGINSKDCIALAYKIANKMNELQHIIVEKKLFESQYRIIDYLISNNILVADNKGLQFFHQTFYDYVYARHFVESKNQAVNYVINNSQSLHIRSSIKMILTYLRVSNEKEYLNCLKKLLTLNQIHFHIKLLAINVIGYNQHPSNSEITFVKTYLLPNRKFRKYFIESIQGSAWIEILINEKVFDNLLTLKKNWIDIFFESNFFSKFKLNNHHIWKNNFISYDDRRINNVNLVYFALNRSLPESRKVVINYISKMPRFNEINWVISRLLYSIKEWDSPDPFKLYEAYKISIKQDIFSFCNILEDAVNYNDSWVIEEFKQYVIEFLDKTNLEHKNRKIDYHLTKLFEKIAIKSPHKSFDAGLDLTKMMSETNIRATPLEENELWDDPVFFSYNHEKERHDIHDIYAETIKLAETFSKNGDPKFKTFFNSHIDSNSIAILKIITFALYFAPENNKEEIIRLITVFNNKNGFDGDGKLQFWIRKLIGKAYVFFEQQQKNVINNILLKITSKNEIRIRFREEKKYHSLKFFGSTKYKYISSIPVSEISLQPQLHKVYLELKRKFGGINNEKEPLRFEVSTVEAPLSQTAYNNMNFVQWEETFLKYLQNEPYFGSGITEHSRAFSAQVKEYPNKFYPFVKKLINENKINNEYLLKGLEGLKDANYNASELLILYKILISNEVGESNSTSLVWMADYFIKSKLIDDQIVDFLIKKALFSKNPEQELNPNDPLFDGINSVRGSAIENLIGCSYDINFKDRIFATAEKVAEDKFVSVKAALLHHLAYLIRLDKPRTLALFLKIMKNDSEKLIDISIHSLQYLVNVNFDQLLPQLKIWIHYKTAQSNLGGILTWCWIKNYKGSSSILKDLHKISSSARAMSVRIAHENLFCDNIEFAKKCDQMFIKHLNDISKKVVEEYDFMFLRFDKENILFDKWLPYLKMYAKSKVASKNPHYFLEYILKNVAKYPTECIDLISNYKKFSKPDTVNGPYYSDEPIKIVLSAYNVLNNNGNQVYVVKAIKLFDNMLHLDYLRKEAHQALDLVER